MTPTEVDNIAKVTGYLAGSDIQQKSQTPGGSIDPKLPVTLYMERKALEWKLQYDPSNVSTLVATAAYVLSMCGIYKDQANIIVNNGTGGVVITGQIASGGGGGGSFTGNLFS